MFTKNQYRLLIISAMGVFFTIALIIYSFYMRAMPPGNHIAISEEPSPVEKQVVMSQEELKIKADTRVVFEIVDQFGRISKTDTYRGVNWLGYTKVQFGQIFDDYLIKEYTEDQVTLTRVIHRPVEPSYVLTTQDGNIIISTQSNGLKTFYKETGLEEHDFSEILGRVLEKGIPISSEQKDAILENADELYKILQEYDE